MMPRFVILIGLRGSGKTTVGRVLASRTGRQAVDLDTLTPGILGAETVAEAWATHGEPAFRAAEVTSLRAALTTDSPAILSLGGGTPTAPGAVDLLNHARSTGAHVIYLHASPTELSARLLASDNSHRPSLTGRPSTSIEEVTQIYEVRDELYRSLANLVVEVDGRSTQQVADLIVQNI